MVCDGCGEGEIENDPMIYYEDTIKAAQGILEINIMHRTFL